MAVIFKPWHQRLTKGEKQRKANCFQLYFLTRNIKNLIHLCRLPPISFMNTKQLLKAHLAILTPSLTSHISKLWGKNTDYNGLKETSGCNLLKNKFQCIKIAQNRIYTIEKQLKVKIIHSIRKSLPSNNTCLSLCQ